MKNAMAKVIEQFPATQAGKAFETGVVARVQQGNAFTASMKQDLTTSMSVRNNKGGFGAGK